MLSKDQIKNRVHNDVDFLVGIRRHLHANPELSEHEHKTAAYISQLLDSWNIPHQTRIGGYGITGLIEGKNPSKKVIALRADMDALPITEENDVPYKSTNKGVMHACGHDVHMTCLLGAVKILNELKNDFEGTVKFIFQPAEELVPGGALRMINEGVLENPTPEAICAQHVFPDLEVGQLGFRSGLYMASSDEVNLYIKGKGGHAAIPDTYDNTILAAAQILVDLNKVITENKSKEIPTVLAFGKLIGDGACNLIPSEVTINGTFRTFDEAWRKKAHELIIQTAQKTAATHGTTCEVVIDKGYPFLINDDKVTRIAKNAAFEFLGKDKVKELGIRTTVEDFARYTQLIPGCFYRLGTANHVKGIRSNLHTSNFNVDEKSIEIGTGFMIWNALAQLKTQN
ncbi:MAG: amidohydrolase [Bacteroidetes bacterium]|nr:amidohydrolase [Bacteroidota bacterium]